MKSEMQSKELDMLKKLSLLLIKERDFDVLFGEILDAAVELTNAEGATFYMVDDSDNTLRFIKILNSKMDVDLSSEDITWPPVKLYDETGNANLKNLAAICYHKKQSFNLPDVYKQDLFDISGTRQYDMRNNYRTRSIVAIPMMDHTDNIIGIIQLINSVGSNNEVVAFAEDDIKNLEILGSISAILMNNQKLISDLRRSFYQFIKSIAWAIDRKAKHFSGHIARVSELSNMIAHGIAENTDDSLGYSEVNFSEDELEEINVAGLMHDLGKIITPMHILDKSSKLETIFNRIELIHSRIDHLHTVISFQMDMAEASKREYFQNELKRINEYREFLDRTNPGRDFLTDTQKDYLTEIYNYRYKYKDREFFIINEDEYYNLSIIGGTLNKEDIKIIREHAYVTGKMLDQITFPKYLANAPKYAEQHHEKLNGSGYPNGLEADDLPLQSRIIALADVFEALTAVRPYKESKTLSQTYSILRRMIDAYEIDNDLFEFALRSGIFSEYADKHLKKEQIDV